MKKPLLVLFDGNAIVHRAYHAFQGARSQTVFTVRSTGEIVTAVYGFVQMLMKVLNELQPSCCAVTFDTKAPTFRHEMYDQYKAHRTPTPDELVNQFGRVREVVDTFHLPIYEMDGYEADDVLGTLSRQASAQGIDTVIVTGDGDTMQLVTPRVKVLYPKAGRTFSDTTLFDEEAVKEKYGVAPRQIIDLKALMGDSSDNIPGVPGIGKKTAQKLINLFGSLEDIYERIEEVNPERIRNILRENEEIARTSKRLATIDLEVPVTLDLDACQTSLYNREEAAKLFRELEFFSLLEKLPGDSADASGEPVEIVAQTPEKKNYHTVTTQTDFDMMMAALSSAKGLVFDMETTSLNAMEAQPVGVSLAAAPGEAWYIPVGHVGWGNVEQLAPDYVFERLRPVFADGKLSKTAHNGKYDIMVLAGKNVPVENLAFDTMIAAHLLNENALGLKSLAFTRLGVEMTPISDLIGTGSKQISMSQVEIATAAEYACADADMTARLAVMFGPELERSELSKLFTEVEMPLVPVLVYMERNGITLDREFLGKMSGDLGEQIIGLEKAIYGDAGKQFNINSPKQLGVVLFEDLQLSVGQKRKGSYSTAAGVLENLRGEHPIIDRILEYRQLTKLKSTYIDALPGMINPVTGRIHTSFNQTRTTTGRLSSSDPNLQNIPIRGELGKKVRRAFITPGTDWMMSGDYSQIDLRALAHLSRDESLVEAFQHDEDIHSSTAARLFGVEVGAVTSDMRRVAKTVNFGVIYGMSNFGLEQATELSREEATGFINAYFEKYPGVRKYLDNTKQEARDKGYVKTLFGRRRTIPDINSPNRQVREAAERMAINMPVQGTSADIIKVAMINLYREMEKRKLKSRMLLQVHDELLFEIPDNELGEMNELVPAMMSSAVELAVPVKVDINTGHNWEELK